MSIDLLVHGRDLQPGAVRMIPMDSGLLLCHVCLDAGSSCLCPLIRWSMSPQLTHHAQPLLLTLTDLIWLTEDREELFGDDSDSHYLAFNFYQPLPSTWLVLRGA